MLIQFTTQGILPVINQWVSGVVLGLFKFYSNLVLARSLINTLQCGSTQLSLIQTIFMLLFIIHQLSIQFTIHYLG